MPPIRVSLAAQNVDKWRDTAKRLRKAGEQGQTLRKKLRTEIANAGKPVLDEVRQAVFDLRVTSSHGGGTTRRKQFAALQAARRAHKRGGDVRAAAVRAAKHPHSLRRDVAAATKLQITTKGVRFVTSSSQLPESQRTLPRHLDSPKGWRHPVFGNRANWVSQRGGPWFASTISKWAPEFRAAIVKAMDDTVSEIEG